MLGGRAKKSLWEAEGRICSEEGNAVCHHVSGLSVLVPLLNTNPSHFSLGRMSRRITKLEVLYSKR